MCVLRNKIAETWLMPVPIKRMQRFVANASVTPSAVRGRHGGKCVMHAAIEFRANLDIALLLNPAAFPNLLDEKTNELCSRLPLDFQFWGTARKCINIFLREASYTRLREAFPLDTLEPVLETPLDRYVVDGLKRDAGRNRVPSWTTIIRLKPEDSAIYQAVATEVSREKYNTYRMNLDFWYWRPVPMSDSE